MDIEQSHSDSVNKPNHSLMSREIDFILKERNKIRLFSPELVYLYRHSSISWLASVVHLISLIISNLLIMITMFVVYYYYNVEIEELGPVSDLTLVHYLIFVGVIFIIYSSLYSVFNYSISFRYKLAMFANSSNLAVLNITKLFFIVAFLYVLLLTSFNLSKAAMFIDYLNSSLWLFLIVCIIFDRAFRFCKKET